MYHLLPAELRTAYEALAHESQRQQQSLAELTRELQARDTGVPAMPSVRWDDLSCLCLFVAG